MTTIWHDGKGRRIRKRLVWISDEDMQNLKEYAAYDGYTMEQALQRAMGYGVECYRESIECDKELRAAEDEQA